MNQVQGIENLFIVKSLDVEPVSPKYSLKQLGKELLKKLRYYKSPHGKVVSKSFFPALYVDPQICDYVLIKIKSKRNEKLSYCYVNGKKTRLRPIGKNMFLAEKNHFWAYENIVTVRKEKNIRDIEIFGAIKNLNFNRAFIFSKRYCIEKLGGGTVYEGNRGFAPYVDDRTPEILSCILTAEIKDENSEFSGLYYTAYDLNYRTYRLAPWIWTNAIIVKTFLLQPVYSINNIYAVKAKILVDRILDFQLKEGENRGSFVARWDVLDTTPMGITPLLSTNDSAFIGAYALISAYEHFREQAYLESARLLGTWLLNKGMSKDGQLYIGYREDIQQMEKKYLFVDAGFTGTLLEALFRITQEEIWLDALQRFTNWFIDHLFDKRNNYFWWNWYSYRKPAKKIFSRGQAWAMDGLLAAYAGTEEEIYRDVLERLSRTLLRYQARDGFWYYILDKPKSGPCAKGTPIIAYHLIRLYRINGNIKLLIAAKKALKWCSQSTYQKKDDARAFGGFYSKSQEGTLYGPRNVKSIFLYSLCYYILAKYEMNRIQGIA